MPAERTSREELTQFPLQMVLSAREQCLSISGLRTWFSIRTQTLHDAIEMFERVTPPPWGGAKATQKLANMHAGMLFWEDGSIWEELFEANEVLVHMLFICLDVDLRDRSPCTNSDRYD